MPPRRKYAFNDLKTLNKPNTTRGSAALGFSLLHAGILKGFKSADEDSQRTAIFRPYDEDENENESSILDQPMRKLSVLGSPELVSDDSTVGYKRARSPLTNSRSSRKRMPSMDGTRLSKEQASTATSTAAAIAAAIGTLSPVPKRSVAERLGRTSMRWKRPTRKNEATSQSAVREARSILNKISPTTYDKLVGKLAEVEITSGEVVAGIVCQIFEQALFSPMFSNLYADLCVLLQQEVERIQREKGLTINFRGLVVECCRKEFLAFSKPLEGVEGSDMEMIQVQRKKRKLANLRFVGELYRCDLIHRKIVLDNCLLPLLTMAADGKDEDAIDALVLVVSRSGKSLCKDVTSRNKVKICLQKMMEIAKLENTSCRSRIVIEEVIAMSKRGWMKRFEESIAFVIERKLPGMKRTAGYEDHPEDEEEQKEQAMGELGKDKTEWKSEGLIKMRMQGNGCEQEKEKNEWRRDGWDERYTGSANRGQQDGRRRKEMTWRRVEPMRGAGGHTARGVRKGAAGIGLDIGRGPSRSRGRGRGRGQRQERGQGRGQGRGRVHGRGSGWGRREM